VHAAEAGPAGVGVTMVRGPLLLLPLLTFLGAPSRRAVVERCEPIRCRCITAADRGISAEELVRRRREYATRVVLGRVMRVESLSPHLVEHGPNQVEVYDLAARVAVSRVWKGPLVDTLTVVFGSTPIVSSCDLTMYAGFSYVIFAAPYDDGALRTRQCTGTAAEPEATATISVLGPGEEPRR